jgi:hypothetical protein
MGSPSQQQQAVSTIVLNCDASSLWLYTTPGTLLLLIDLSSLSPFFLILEQKDTRQNASKIPVFTPMRGRICVKIKWGGSRIQREMKILLLQQRLLLLYSYSSCKEDEHF